MRSSSRLAAFATLGLTVAVNATRTVTSLQIVNRNISPDGFLRPTVLANGTFPGPVISGHKVSIYDNIHQHTCLQYCKCQGDNFKINVIDKLTDHSMLKSTSIVSELVFMRENLSVAESFFSIGTVSSREERIGLMVRLLLPNVLLRLEIRSCMISMSPTRPVRTAYHLSGSWH